MHHEGIDTTGCGPPIERPEDRPLGRVFDRVRARSMQAASSYARAASVHSDVIADGVNICERIHRAPRPS
jgi:hypothetical protein